MSSHPNVDRAEIDHFDRFGEDWWNPAGGFRTLHEINPVRLDFIAGHATLGGASVVDVGCGGGILTEGLAARGARALGIDMSGAALEAARRHLREAAGPGAREEPDCTYRQLTAEALADEGAQFDVVTCLEMLEHVPDPAAVISACARLCRPGGRVVFSTINRTAKAYALAVLGAEYVLGLLPRGTHDYAKFLRPSELDAAARDTSLTLLNLRGMHYDPIRRTAKLTNDVSVNYLACYERSPGTVQA